MVSSWQHIRRTAVVLGTVLAYSSAGLAQNGNMLFLGFHDVKSDKNYWCWDRQFENVEISQRNQYDQLKSEFVTTNKGLNPFTILIGSSESVIVYTFEKRMPGFNCTKKAAGFVKGRSMIEAQYELDHLPTDRDVVTPYTPAFRWAGEKQIETLVATYDAVHIKYMYGQGSNGKTAIVMQARNTSKTDIAVLITRALDDPERIEKTQIKPGQKISKSISTTQGVEVQFRYVKPDDIIELLKDFVGNIIKMQNGKLEQTPVQKQAACMCVRG